MKLHPALLHVLLASLAIAQAGAQDEQYTKGADSMPKDGVPQGNVSKHRWESQIFPGTVRDYWVYVPAQYDASGPAAIFIAQDGGGFVNAKGAFNAPVVFDNLIDAGEMPVTIGIFVNPGEVPPAKPGQKPRRNRSFEYDSLGDQYTRFLLEEIIPEVGKSYRLSDDPAMRCICGNSSGGICAFTAAWERPDAFGKVISHIGSFTNIRGGHVYPALIRKTERKAIRVFLQDGSNDLDNLHGHWPLSNQQMAAALKFAGYDYKFVYGEGRHSGRHGGAIFPDTLRWIWRDWKVEN